MLKKIIKLALEKIGYQIAPIDLIPTSRFGVDSVFDINRILADPKLSSRLPKKQFNVVFDVGANIGQTSMKLALSYPSARIYAFEPVEETFSKLKANVNEFPSISCYQAGFGNTIETKKIFVYESSLLSSFISQSPMMSSDISVDSIDIEIRTLDHFCLEHGIDYIDLLKIDTEGFDLNVLQGASNLLKRQAVSFIYFEFFRVGYDGDNSSGGRLIDTHDYLINFGFRPVSFYTDFIHHKHTAGVYNALYMKWE